jgi:Zn-dependent protease with chaperone function
MGITRRTEKAGQAYDDIIASRHRLRAIHLLFALIASFSLSTGKPIPHFNAWGRGGGWTMMVLSIFGWGPYFVSWLYSRPLIDGSIRAVNAFGAGALIVTICGASIFQNAFGWQPAPSVPLVSAGITICLLCLAKAGAKLWPSPLNGIS